MTNNDITFAIPFALGLSLDSNHDMTEDYTSSLHYGNTPIQIYRKFHLQKRKSFR